MKKEYKCPNYCYTIEVVPRHEESFGERIDSPPNYEPFKHLMEDLSDYASSYSNWLVIRQCLDNLKHHDEVICKGRVDHFRQVVKNINDYVETGTSDWDK